jgi:hypothetical protein
VDAHTFTKQAEGVQTNLVCQKADCKRFLGHETSANGGIHAIRDNNDVRSVLQNTEIIA